MTPGARVAAAIEILDAVLAGAPAEKVLTTWARRSRFAGSKDRAAIRDHVFDALRRRRSCAWLGGAETGRALMIGLLRGRGEDPGGLFTGAGHAPPGLSEAEMRPADPETAPRGVRLDCPDWLLPDFEAGLGTETDAVLETLRSRAPVFLRWNRAATDGPGAIAALAADGIAARPHGLSPTALEVTGNARRVQGAAAYRDGLVEIQDAASQAVVDTLPLEGARRVLDYCAGGGGKALALAARAGPGTRIAAHDAVPRRMADLPARAVRAGAAIDIVDTGTLGRDGPWDVILCDAPCSGSGAWRRQPEARWRLTPEALAALTRTQDEILDAAAALLAPDGVLAYATCSLLRRENDDRIAAFLARHPGWRCGFSRALTPLDGGDGFFVAHLTRRDSQSQVVSRPPSRPLT